MLNWKEPQGKDAKRSEGVGGIVYTALAIRNFGRLGAKHGWKPKNKKNHSSNGFCSVIMSSLLFLGGFSFLPASQSFLIGVVMKDGIGQILGRTVSGVIIAKNERRSPRYQLFLTFSDGTYFEIWGDSVACAGGIDRGGADAAIAYAESFGAHITARYPQE